MNGPAKRDLDLSETKACHRYARHSSQSPQMSAAKLQMLWQRVASWPARRLASPRLRGPEASQSLSIAAEIAGSLASFSSSGRVSLLPARPKGWLGTLMRGLLKRRFDAGPWTR